jgi:hypothetical protein
MVLAQRISFLESVSTRRMLAFGKTSHYSPNELPILLS